MNATRHRAVLSPLVILVGAALLTSCVDERIVFRDRPFFTEPVAAAHDFLGYSDAEDKLTVCGQCHVGQQSTWQGTAHASAWTSLEGHPAAQASCEGCHTVNSLGNVVEGQVGGYLGVKDERYHDVQCESCHGPGLPHVRNPSNKDAQPHAPLVAAPGLEYGCGECHSGSHQPFVEEWAASPHGNMDPYPAGRHEAEGGCYLCHSGEGALKKFGVRANYLEKEDLLATGSEFAHITCAVCHDPHSSEFEGQLRFPVRTTSIETHLCAQCHNRATVPATGPRGLNPHAPEAQLVAGHLGAVGWIPPGMDLDEDRIRGTHGSEANPRLCATCHVVPFSTPDALTGETFFSVGHGFRAIPCVDEAGLPTGEHNCAISTSARDWRGCTTGGCHGDATAVVSATNTALASILNRARDLYKMLREIDPNLDGPGGEINPADATFTVAEGAFFNLRIAHHGTAVHSNTFIVPRADSLAAFAPSAVHNPFLIESLLIWSIEAVRNEYGVSPSPGFDPTPQIRGHPLR